MGINNNLIFMHTRTYCQGGLPCRLRWNPQPCSHVLYNRPKLHSVYHEVSCFWFNRSSNLLWMLLQNLNASSIGSPMAASDLFSKTCVNSPSPKLSKILAATWLILDFCTGCAFLLTVFQPQVPLSNPPYLFGSSELSESKASTSTRDASSPASPKPSTRSASNVRACLPAGPLTIAPCLPHHTGFWKFCSL